jgi:hypothetical protein
MTTKSRLVAPVIKLGKQKIVTATIIDVLGDLCSVRLSTRGASLHSLKYIGPTPIVGDVVIVDFKTGKPVVYTNSENLESRIDELRRELTAETEASVSVQNPAPEQAFTIADGVRRFLGNAGAPTVNDDETLGYMVTDVWMYEASDLAYICTDATEGAAAWLELGAGGVEEAPINGSIYARQDAAWVTVETGGTGVVYDDLTSQIPDASDHFDLVSEASGAVLLFYNTTMQSTSTFTMDGDNLGLTTSFSPVAGDVLIAVYGLTIAAGLPPALKVFMFKSFR